MDGSRGGFKLEKQGPRKSGWLTPVENWTSPEGERSRGFESCKMQSDYTSLQMIPTATWQHRARASFGSARRDEWRHRDLAADGGAFVRRAR